MSGKRRILLKIYDVLLNNFGPQHWWPGDTPLEIIVGAILTQNTNWANVEKALANLKAEGLLDAKKLTQTSLRKLSRLVRPSGYFNVKARRLKSFFRWLDERYECDLDKMFAQDTTALRQELLEVPGVGPETADSILLYAGNKLTFVVDAYTRRVLSRHGLISKNATYDQIKALFETYLPRNLQMYNEYHALFVAVGKRYCKPRPLCQECPLGKALGTGEFSG